MSAESGQDAASLYPPHVLREYALLADGERGALVGPRGDIAWMCAPQWHSDAVFSSLIGGSGCYAVTPADPRFVWGGYYEDGSLIWRSRWITTDGVIECREALAYPADPRTAVLLRRIEAQDAPARVRVLLDPRAGFGRHKMTRLNREDAVWTARSGPLHLRWSGGGDARERDDGGLELIVELAPGATSRPGPGGIRRAPWPATRCRPRPPGKPPRPPGQPPSRSWAASLAPRASRHSYAVLAGLTSSGGGMVAAATMSLPERAKAGRNYDYRYVWIRDQCYTGQAVAADGPHRLLDDAVDFVASRILDDGPELKPAYTINGGRVPDEHTLSRLAGYPGGSDKAGNWVNQQFQLDAPGEALLLFAAAARHDHLDTSHWRAAEAAVAVIKARQSDPDAGVWELGNQRWTHSRLMCVAGLRAIAAAGAAGRQASDWEALADAILADAAHDCLHASGRWQRAPGDQRTDAALLLPAIRGATTAADPRAAGHPAGGGVGAGPRRLPVPVPPRPAPPARGRGRVRAVRIRDGPGPAAAGPREGGGGLVRAQPGRLRTARPAHRGIRRPPAAAARQHPAGLRPCPHVRIRRAPLPDLG